MEDPWFHQEEPDLLNARIFLDLCLLPYQKMGDFYLLDDRFKYSVGIRSSVPLKSSGLGICRVSDSGYVTYPWCGSMSVGYFGSTCGLNNMIIKVQMSPLQD